jgi:hypothetical protein
MIQREDGRIEVVVVKVEERLVKLGIVGSRVGNGTVILELAARPIPRKYSDNTLIMYQKWPPARFLLSPDAHKGQLDRLSLEYRYCEMSRL